MRPIACPPTSSGPRSRKRRSTSLGETLGTVARHFLLMTATPHAGKEEDFQLFLALLDSDRFEGRFRDGVHAVDPSDLMRRVVKEKLLTFAGQPLFPERRATTVDYELSDDEMILYDQVTEYVREQMNRADRLTEEGQGRRGNTVGFALTMLQRRLASSPGSHLPVAFTPPETSGEPDHRRAPTGTSGGVWDDSTGVAALRASLG